MVADLPVGNNYQGHVTTDAPDFVLREPIAISQYKADSFWALFDYIVFGTGEWVSQLGRREYKVQSLGRVRWQSVELLL